jgi:DNA polymerase-3 subunit epsilon
VAVAIAERYEQVAASGVWELHQRQRDWHAERAEGYRQWLLRQGRTEEPGGASIRQAGGIVIPR